MDEFNVNLPQESYSDHILKASMKDLFPIFGFTQSENLEKFLKIIKNQIDRPPET